jgi:hypothetical protein
MMGGSLGVDSNSVSGDVCVDTSSMPWVVVTVEEYDFRVVCKVLAWFSTSKVVKGPEVFRVISIIHSAHFIVAVFIPVVPGEAALRGVITLRHWELTACLNSPSTGI